MAFGDFNIQAYWNATTNTPILKSGKGIHGSGYKVSVAGSTNLDGVTNWQVGDIAIFILDQWVQITNTAAAIADTPIVNNSSTAPRTIRNLMKDWIGFGSDDLDTTGSTNSAVMTANTAKLQAIINEAQATNKKIWSRVGQAVTAINAPLTASLGRASGVRSDLFFDGNGLTIAPQFTDYALKLNSICLSANRNTGDNVARLSLQGLVFDLSFVNTGIVRSAASGGTPAIYAGAKAIFLGGDGKSFHPFGYTDGFSDILTYGSRDTLSICLQGEVYHLTFRGVVTRSGNGGGLTQSVLTTGDNQGEFNFYNCEFAGNSAAPPLSVYSSDSTGSQYTSMAGLHHHDTVLYGTGSIIQAVGYGVVRDVYLPNCQIDNSGLNQSELEVPALTLQTTGAGSAVLQNIDIDNLYVEGPFRAAGAGWTGAAIRILRGNAANFHRGIKITNLHAWNIDRNTVGAGIVELFGAQDVTIDGGSYFACNAPNGSYLWADQTSAGIPSSGITFANQKTVPSSPGTVGVKTVFANGVLGWKRYGLESLITTLDLSETSPSTTTQKDSSGDAISLNKTASQTISATSATLVTWAGANFDPLSRFVSASNAIRATKPGTMRIKWKLAYTSSVTAGDIFTFQIFKNGGAVPGGTMTYTIPAAAFGTLMDTVLVTVALNDLIDLRCLRTSGTGGFIIQADAPALTNLLEAEMIA